MLERVEVILDDWGYMLLEDVEIIIRGGERDDLAKFKGSSKHLL